MREQWILNYVNFLAYILLASDWFKDNQLLSQLTHAHYHDTVPLTSVASPRETDQADAKLWLVAMWRHTVIYDAVTDKYLKTIPGFHSREKAEIKIGPQCVRVATAFLFALACEYGAV